MLASLMRGALMKRSMYGVLKTDRQCIFFLFFVLMYHKKYFLSKNALESCVSLQ